MEKMVSYYLPESKCGLVKILHLERGDEDDDCLHRVETLIKEAKISLNKEAQVNGYQGVCEIFYIAANLSSVPRFQLSCLYEIGFRLVETELQLGTSMQNNCIHLLVYKPSLVPDFQSENGALPGQIETNILVKFLKELLISTGGVKSGITVNGVKELQVLIRNLEESGMSKLFVRSSFPWHGRAGVSDNQVAIVGGGISGLAAAASLSEFGFDVVLLEASNYLGGRVKQAKPFKGFAPIDVGGEFLHGSDSIINRIAKENGWPVQACYGREGMKTEDMFYHKGELLPLLSEHPDIKKAWQAWDEIIALWDKLGEKEDFVQNSEHLDKESRNDTVLLRNASKREHKSHAQTDAHTVNSMAAGVAELKETQEMERRENYASENLRAPFTPYADTTILEWLKKRQCNEDEIAVFDAMYCQTVAAATNQMGVFESMREENAWNYGDGNYRLVGSYSKLVKYLLDKCTKVDKRLCWQVKEIDWEGIARTADGKLDKMNSNGNVFLKNQHGEELSAKYVVITVPLTILKDGDINFIPALPSNKRKAIDAIEMRGALKIVCRFKSQIWPDNMNLIYSVRGFLSQIWMYTRDSTVSKDKCHVIAGFQTAAPAEEKIGLSREEVLDGFLRQLDEIFRTDSDPHPATDSLVNYVYYHWSKHPFIRGGYSSPTAHAQGMRHVLASPLDGLYFAGEATSITACATVHTAMETGFRAADEVCSHAKRVNTVLPKTGYAE